MKYRYLFLLGNIVAGGVLAQHEGHTATEENAPASQPAAGHASGAAPAAAGDPHAGHNAAAEPAVEADPHAGHKPDAK